jgi:hypothetical protein
MFPLLRCVTNERKVRYSFVSELLTKGFWIIRIGHRMIAGSGAGHGKRRATAMKWFEPSSLPPLRLERLQQVLAQAKRAVFSSGKPVTPADVEELPDEEIDNSGGGQISVEQAILEAVRELPDCAGTPKPRGRGAVAKGYGLVCMSS